MSPAESLVRVGGHDGTDEVTGCGFMASVSADSSGLPAARRAEVNEAKSSSAALSAANLSFSEVRPLAVTLWFQSVRTLPLSASLSRLSARVGLRRTSTKIVTENEFAAAAWISPSLKISASQRSGASAKAKVRADRDISSHRQVGSAHVSGRTTAGEGE